MPEPAPKLSVAPIELKDVASITLMHLVATPNGVQLVTSSQSEAAGFPRYKVTLSAANLRPVLSVLPGALFSIPQLLPAIVSWDVSYSASERGYRCAFEKPGGATNALLLRDQKGNSIVLSQTYPLESFSKPRFVRNERADRRPSVSAIVNNKSLVVFPKEPSGSEDAYTRIGDWDDGLLISTGRGYVVFAKRDVGGPARDGVLPGILSCLRLDEQFRPLQPPIEPFGQSLIHEFDADLVPGLLPHECFVVVASGQHEAVFAYSIPPRGNFVRIPFRGQFDPAQVTRPAIAVVEKDVSVAFIEAARTKEARVWVGAISLEPVTSTDDGDAGRDN